MKPIRGSVKPLKTKMRTFLNHLSPLGFQRKLLVIFLTKFRFDKSITRSAYGKKIKAPNFYISTDFALLWNSFWLLFVGKIWYFKWIHSFESNHLMNLQFQENSLYLTLIRFPALTTTAAKLNLIVVHSILFETKHSFKNHFAGYVNINMISLKLYWFQTLLVSKWDFWPKLDEN